jgi:hypothetical protein
MTHATDTILARIRELQEQLETEFDRRRDAFLYRLDNGRVIFDAEARRRQRALRVRLSDFLRQTRPMVVLTAPLIYSLIIPFVVLDLMVTLFQRLCFPVYRIAPARRADFIRIDRHHLAYLNALQKLNCIYCGYCNGVIAYVQEVAGRTEAYWCPIKHAARVGAQHNYYAQFVDYGDAAGFQDGLAASRTRIAPPPTG